MVYFHKGMLEHVTEPIHCHYTTVATSESAINNSIFNNSSFVQLVHSTHALFGDIHTFSCMLSAYF